MRNHSGYAFAILCFFMLTMAADARPTPTIEGLALGMTADEAEMVLRAQHIASRVTPRPCLSDYLAMQRSTVPPAGPGRCTQSMFAQTEAGSLLVFFNEALPDRPGVSVVTTIAVNSASDTMMADVAKQAGAPTLTDGPVLIWCFDYACKSGDDWDEPYAGRQLLEHQGSGLTLADPRAERLYEQSLGEQLKAHGVTIRA